MGDRGAMPPRLARAAGIVADAAEMALAAFRHRDSLSLRPKKPQGFVSAADEAVERMICKRLGAEFPDDTVFAEEGEAGAGNGTGACWFIDPIDGSTNFLRGLPLWGVSLGLVLQGRPWIGVVALPALGLMVAAEIGFGLFVDGRPVSRSAVFDHARVVSVGDADEDLDESLALTRRLRRTGWMVESYRCPCLGLTLSALGRLDGHLQRCVQARDIAGGLVLCAEAGLEVRHGPLDGQATWVAAGTPDLLRDEASGALAQAPGHCHQA